MGNLISFTKHRLRKSPVIYTIVFTHDEDGFHFEVFDIQDSKKDRRAVARDLEMAAKNLLDSK